MYLYKRNIVVCLHLLVLLFLALEIGAGSPIEKKVQL